MVSETGFAVTKFSHGMKDLKKANELATKYGLLVPYQSAEAKNNVAVATRKHVVEMSKLSKESTFSGVIPDFANLDVNNVYNLLKIYNKCGWRADYIKQNDDIKRAIWPYGVPNDLNCVNSFFKNRALGRTFNNVGHILPKGSYTEWDATMLKTQNNTRDAERFVIGGGRVYYTGDHYKSFLRLE
ncbi:MAG: hypothetical protein IKE05_04430 [Clostridia bacterium]|nr:hypothetical protein [Clostridia bacterium]